MAMESQTKAKQANQNWKMSLTPSYKDQVGGEDLSKMNVIYDIEGFEFSFKNFCSLLYVFEQCSSTLPSLFYG